MIRVLAVFLLTIGGLLVAYGIFALDAGERSAAHGGGLLSGFGFIPIILGLILAAISVVTLLAARRRA